METTEATQISKKHLAPMHAMHTDKTRYAMNGLLFDEQGVTGTDGKILVHVRAPGFAGCRVVPGTVVKEWAKTVRKARSTMPYVEVPEVEGIFPPYQEVMPALDGRNWFEIDVSTLARLAGTVVAFYGRIKGVRTLRTRPTAFDLEATWRPAGGGNGEAMVPLNDSDVVGELVEVALDAALTLRVVKAAKQFGADTLKVSWPKKATEGVVFESGDFYAIQMPLGL